jgi:hypothetical protein
MNEPLPVVGEEFLEAQVKVKSRPIPQNRQTIYSTILGKDEQTDYCCALSQVGRWLLATCPERNEIFWLCPVTAMWARE